MKCMENVANAAEVLKRNLRKDDMVIRAGDDEFLVLLTGITSLTDADSSIKKIIQALKIPLL